MRVARKRMLDPAFFTSNTVNQLTIPQAMTFAGLWCYVDDWGRGEDDPVMVKSVVWPRRRSQTEAKVAADLAELASFGLICRYEVNAYPILHVVSWQEHQKISHRSASKLPPCRKHEPGLWAVFAGDDDPALAKYRSDSGGTPEWLRRDSMTDQFSRRELKLRQPSGEAPELVDVPRRAAEARAAIHKTA